MISERLQNNINMFNRINKDCLDDPDSHDQFVPLIAEHAEFYAIQLENLEADEEEISEFVQWIDTQ